MSTQVDLQKLEHQQALLLGALLAARGEPVSYAELRDAGVEFPASVVCELELAGVSIERCYDGASGARRVLGVRLMQPRGAHPELIAAHARSSTGAAAPPIVPAAAAPLVARELQAGRSSPAGAGRFAHLGLALRGNYGQLASRSPVLRALQARRWPTLLTGVAAAAILAALALAGLSALAGGPRRASGAHARHATVKTIAQNADASASAAPRAHPTAVAAVPPTPVSGALAAELEARGHELLESGAYGEAVPVLRRALGATGESLDGCLEPTSEQCLTYAYALFDLGRALLLNGSPTAAVPVLERRLQIENQRPVVAVELESARRELG